MASYIDKSRYKKIRARIDAGDFDGVKEELGYDSNPNYTPLLRKTLLQAAIDVRNEDIALLLIEKGADPDREGFNFEERPYMAATRKNLPRVVAEIVKHKHVELGPPGHDDMLVGKQYVTTPLGHAREEGFHEIADIILAAQQARLEKDIERANKKGTWVSRIGAYFNGHSLKEVKKQRDRLSRKRGPGGPG